MKRKLFFVAASLMTLLLFTGCGDYSSIEAQLSEVEIENRLPDVPEEDFSTVEEAEDAIYEQQIAACEMLTDSYDKTYYANFIEDVQGSKNRIMEICNTKRMSIDADIEMLYKENIYAIMEEVEDCPNVEAFVNKTYDNVKTFYDQHNKYETAENDDVALTDILVYYYDRTNLLAKSFLARNEEDVLDAAVAVIEGNAQADEEFRFYINKNNTIIKALNEIFGGVSAAYAERIEVASDKLAINLLNSLTLSDRERGLLMDEMGLSTPTPTPKPTATPKPSASPTPTPKPTTKPTATPKATTRPAGASNSNQGSSSTSENPSYVLD